MRLTSPSHSPWYGYAQPDAPLPHYTRRSLFIGYRVIEVRCLDCRQIASCAAFAIDGDVYIACLSTPRLRGRKQE
jgi:hypothetical protein